MRGRLCRPAAGVGAALVSIAVAVASPQPAGAMSAAGTAEVIGGDLVFTAAPGVDNKVEFFVHKDDGLWHVRDTAAAITAIPACVPVTEHEVKCPGVLTILADTKDGNDTLGVREKTPTAQPVSLAAAGQVAGWEANMTLLGGPGNDKLTGGWGDDVLDGGPGADYFEDWDGVDTVTYASRTGTVVADPDGAAGDDGEPGEGDTITVDVENLVGGAGADTLTGTHGVNKLRGGAGRDSLSGLQGADRLYGEAGYDLLNGGGQTDVCFLGADGAQTVGCEAIYT